LPEKETPIVGSLHCNKQIVIAKLLQSVIITVWPQSCTAIMSAS